MINKEIIKQLFVLKSKFAASSGIATLVDFGVFQSLISWTQIPEEIINIISSSIGMLINFLLQKKYIFKLNRSIKSTFLLSFAVSIGGIFLSTTIIYLLTKITIFAATPMLAKIVATGIVFFYNFYLKRFVFEKKFI
ncbi:MAG: GtrA family protein [Saprospiraceae bacterium]